MADTKEIEFKNYILDNVHGFIGLTEMENEIERLPIFKRLQDISQLGLVKRIFPGALHNRYIHSLGVMHVIDQMALHLDKFSVAERQLLRLAGMLHDLGHYPLSHDLEQVYDKAVDIMDNQHTPAEQIFYEDTAEKFEKIMSVKEDANGNLVCDDTTKPKLELVERRKYHHESVTARVIENSNAIRKIIIKGISKGCFDDSRKRSEENIEEVANAIIADICALIQGNGQYLYEKNGAFPEHFTAMMQLLHSELDADRIDYLLRDATFSGASYGTFDLGILLQNLDMEQCEHGEWIVGVKPKGIGCADQYMVNRYLAYTQVIFHKYTSIIAKMLREVVGWMMNNEAGFHFYRPADIDRLIEQHEKNNLYLYFTDSYFFEKLNSINKEINGYKCPDDIYYFAEQLRLYSALSVADEEVFSGNELQQKKHYLNSTLYKELLDEQASQGTLWLLEQKKITNHVPYEQFVERFNQYTATHSDALNFESYEIDRLMDGLAVIKGDGHPQLLIDNPGSMMREIYNLEQTMLRKYKCPYNLS